MALVVETTTIGPNDASKDSLNDWIWVIHPTKNHTSEEKLTKDTDISRGTS
jgi:hypothetical protein